MTEDDHKRMADLRDTWQPPPRPEWVQKLNEEGRCMDIRWVVPLDEQSLIGAATRATGLSDFGTEEWREPFATFVKSLDEEGDLNLMGRLLSRSDIVLLLKARLQVEDTYKRHPEIADQEVSQPIIVLGQGRSGTSFLINTLASNPDNGALTEWESKFPCPPPEKTTYRTDPRIEQAHLIASHWNRVVPTMASMHEWSGYVPQECCEVLAMTFLAPSWLGTLGQAASYDAYVAKQDRTPAYEYHRRVLKLLQWRNPRRHWVLKDTQHMDHLALVRKIYPNACFAWPHRDPVRALASVISLMGTSQWARSDHPFKGGSYEFVTDVDYSSRRLNAVIDELETGIVPPRQMFHILYPDLIRDPLGTITDMYAHFGIALSEAGRGGMVKYLSDNPRTARPTHRFSTGSPQVVARARAAYKRYQDYFKIQSEE